MCFVFKTVLTATENKVHFASDDCDVFSMCAETAQPRVEFFFEVSLFIFSFYDLYIDGSKILKWITQS